MIVQIQGWRAGSIVKIMELEVTEGEEQALKEMSSVIHAASGPLDHVAVTWTDKQPVAYVEQTGSPVMDSTDANYD